MRIEGVPSQRPRELYPGNDVQVDVKVVSYTTDITHCRMSGPTYFSANSGQPTERCERFVEDVLSFLALGGGGGGGKRSAGEAESIIMAIPERLGIIMSTKDNYLFQRKSSQALRSII